MLDGSASGRNRNFRKIPRRFRFLFAISAGMTASSGHHQTSKQGSRAGQL
jgi:hypothetical protein